MVAITHAVVSDVEEEAVAAEDSEAEVQVAEAAVLLQNDGRQCVLFICSCRSNTNTFSSFIQPRRAFFIHIVGENYMQKTN